MTPKARDLQEPGQHDMIEALRDALRQYNSEEFNPRMREALKDFRENLQFHPYVRRLEKRRTMARTAGWRLFAFTRVRVVAGLVAIAGISIASVLLITARPPNLFAAVLEAMAEVKTAHMVTTHGYDLEMWLSADHGVRIEDPQRIQVLAHEATWVYHIGENKVIISEPQPDVLVKALRGLSGTEVLEELSRDSSRYQYRVSDVILDGVAAKRIDVNTEEVMMRLWVDSESMRVIATEIWATQEDGSETMHVGCEVEYDVPLDMALFTFEPPADATVVDSRPDAQTPGRAIEKNPDFARKLIDAVYAGSLSAVADSLDEPTRRYHPDWVIAGTAAVLRQQFGTVKDLEFESIKPVQQFWVEVVWAVIAEHGSFEMKLTFDAEGKVAGVWFRFSSDAEWTTAMELGVDYVKERKRETSAQNGD